MAPAAEHKDALEDGGHGPDGLQERQASLQVAATHPGLPPTLDEIELAAADATPQEEHGQRVAFAADDAPSSPALKQRKGVGMERSASGLPGGLGQHHRQLTLKDVAGEYSAMTHLPPPRNEKQNSSPIPILRWGAVYYWLARQNLGTCWYSLKRFVYKGLVYFAWLVSLLWWQLAIAVLASLWSLGPVRVWAQSTLAQQRLEELVDIHGIFGGFLGFVIAFRTNNAYQSYVEGRRLVGQLMNQLREVVLEVYAAVPRREKVGGDDDEHATALLETAREVRRLCNVLFAFIRQDVREARNGFLPGSDLEHVSFDPQKNYFHDPCRPRLWDMLSEDETARYAMVPSRMRPCAVASEIMHVAAAMARDCQKAGHHAPAVAPTLKAILATHESMARINSCAIPYPMLGIVHMTTFLFVYTTPLVYLFHTSFIGTMFCVFSLVVSYYGLLVIAEQFERPYAYCHGSFNLELESFGLQCHDDLLGVARHWANDDKSFVPKYLSFPGPAGPTSAPSEEEAAAAAKE